MNYKFFLFTYGSFTKVILISENENAAIVIIYIWQKEGADF